MMTFQKQKSPLIINTTEPLLQHDCQ